MSNLITKPLSARELTTVLQTTEKTIHSVFRNIGYRPELLKHNHSQVFDTEGKANSYMEESLLLAMPAMPDRNEYLTTSSTIVATLIEVLGNVLVHDVRIKSDEAIISISFLSQANRKPYRETDFSTVRIGDNGTLVAVPR